MMYLKLEPLEVRLLRMRRLPRCPAPPEDARPILQESTHDADLLLPGRFRPLRLGEVGAQLGPEREADGVGLIPGRRRRVGRRLIPFPLSTGTVERGSRSPRVPSTVPTCPYKDDLSREDRGGVARRLSG